MAKNIVAQIRDFGRPRRGWLGVKIQQVTPDIAESLGMKEASGALVAGVNDGGPADKAKLHNGDIILKFNGQDVDKSSDLPRLVGATGIGSRASVTVWRRGSQLELPVTVAELRDDDAAPGKGPQPKKPAPQAPTNALGLQVSDLTAAQKRDMKAATGVMVDAADGRAAAAGIQEGDLVLQVNNVEITGAAQFNALVAKLDPKKTVALLVQRDKASRYLVIKPRP
jgi:serine protease Do